nr:putative ribonuclease H-like domain-containing protein [Tanacetum cinerariifolium]
MRDKKNSVLFTKIKCLILYLNFKLIDESQVLLRVPKQSNMYSFDLQNVVPSGDLTCLFAKASIEESNLWHMRLGHVTFKTMNKLVTGNLVRGLPSNIFDNDHSCVACQKRKQHKATCKAKLVSSISQPLQMLHMGLFGPTSVMSINHKKYCLVVIDDFNSFSWVFFLATKDEINIILKPFISAIENQPNKKVKVIRCDNGTEFKYRDLDEFCGRKGIKREYSTARTPQQNRVAERKNKTLIEAARTMLADSLLPITFWDEAVNTACYVLNRALKEKKEENQEINTRSTSIGVSCTEFNMVTIELTHLLSLYEIICHKEKLTDTNFFYWHINLRIIIKYEGNFDIIETPIPNYPIVDAHAAKVTTYRNIFDEREKIARLVLETMPLELQKKMGDLTIMTC